MSHDLTSGLWNDLKTASGDSSSSNQGDSSAKSKKNFKINPEYLPKDKFIVYMNK